MNNMFRCLLIILIVDSVALAQSNGKNSLLNSSKQSDVSSDLNGFFYEKKGKYFYRNNNYDSADFYYLKALKIHLVNNDISRIAACFNDLGVSKSAQDDIDSSIYYYKKALDLYHTKSDSTKYAYVAVNLGINYKNKGDHKKSIDHLLNAVRILEELDEKRALSKCYNTLGSIHNRRKEFEQSLFYHKKAFEIRIRIGSDKLRASSLNNIGLVFMNQKKYDSALSYYKASLAIKIRLGDRKKIASSMNNIGVALMNLGQLDKAEHYLKEALMIRSEIVDKQGEIITLNNLGRLYCKLGNYDNSDGYLDRALFLAEDLGLIEEKLDNLDIRMKCYEHRGDYEHSLMAAKDRMALEDSILSTTERKNILEMITKYETEKKDREIVLLSQQKDIDQLWIVALVVIILLTFMIVLFLYYRFKKERADKLKEQLFQQELHHRVKNNLQILSSIFSLQSRYISDQSALDAVKSGESRVNAMALIHAKLRSAKGNKNINLKEYVITLVEELGFSYGYSAKKNNISIEVEDREIDVDKAISLGLIINELVSNSFKYAFPTVDTPSLKVKMKVTQNAQLLLEVEDNGNNPELDFESNESMGLNIIKSLGRQLKAKINWATEQGVKFSCQLSLN